MRKSLHAPLVTTLLLTYLLSSFPAYSQNHQPFICNIGYRMPLINKDVINSNHGIFSEAGIDVGAFISDKITIGLIAGMGWRDHFWSTSFQNEFVTRYKVSLQTETISALTSVDSAVIMSSQDFFSQKKGTSFPLPVCKTNSFHNVSLYYGLIIGLRCVPFLSYKIYTGTTRSNYLGDAGEVTREGGYTVLQLRRRMIGFECMIQKLSLFKSTSLNKRTSHIGLSVYYEYMQMSSSSLYFNNGEETAKIPLKNFLNAGFFSNYNSVYLTGIKFFYSIY